MKTGIVFKIQKYSIHDGPGIRTAVFFKGCPLDCWWCHNPESQDIGIEVVHYPGKCIRCGKCVRVCADSAISTGCNGIVMDKKKCTNCGCCIEVCPGGAMEPIGKSLTVADVMKEIEKDLVFYDESGGGVTFTGGEPFMQFDYLQELLLQCHNKEIHTAIETSGYTAWENLENASRYTDLFLYDLKLMDDAKHMKYTGVSNQLILENLKKLSGIHKNIHIRIPLIPGINDDNENIDCTCMFLKDIHISKVDILPYHNTGMYKYEQLGLDYRLASTKSPDKQELDRIMELFSNRGFSVSIGG